MSPAGAFRSPALGAGIFVAFVCLALILGDGWRAWSAWNSNLRNAGIITQNLTRSLAEHVQDSFEFADAVLVTAVNRLERTDLDPTRFDATRGIMIDMISASQKLRSIRVVDANGDELLGTLGPSQNRRVSRKDREWFQHHVNDPSRAAFIGPPIRSLSTGEWILTLSRRFNHADGSFAGVVVVAITMEFFQKFYDTFDIGADGAIGLARADGMLLVRRPFVEENIGANLAKSRVFSELLPKDPVGTLEGDAALDGHRRLISYRRLSRFPLVMFVALSKDDVLADWWRSAEAHLVGVVLLAALIAVLGFRLARQVADRDAAERAAAAAAAHYRLLADHSTDMIVRQDFDGVRHYVSPGSRNVLGYEPEELVGTAIGSNVHPDDRERLAALWRQLRDGADQITSTNRIRRKDGRYIWVEATLNLVRDPVTGQPVEIVTVVRDINQRKEAEARLMDAVESISDGFVLWDESGRFIMCNSRFRELYAVSADLLAPGLSKADWLVAQIERGQYGPLGDPAGFAATSLRHFQQAEGVFEVQLGDGRWLLGSNRRTVMGGWVGIRTDITSQKLREFEINDARRRLESQAADLTSLAEALSLAKTEAEQASLAKSEFLATMSHEIRTPMNGIIGMNGLLLRTPLNADQKRFAEAVRLSADALLMIINDILDVAKLEAGKIELESVDFTLDSVIEDAAELLSPRAHQKGLDLASYLSPLARRPMRGDAGRLRQIVLNLLSNAVKFTSSGFVAVEAQARAEADDRYAVRIEVIDTGIGILPANQERLFQKFEQADRSTTRRFGGTGLGLNISKQLIELMGGSIGVCGRPGGGSIFWVEFSMAAGSMPMPRVPGVPGVLRGKRVLVVDDIEINRSVFARGLAEDGMLVEAVADGSTALDQISRDEDRGQGFDIILLDQLMPGMAGEHVAQAIRRMALKRQPKLILLTSAGAPDKGDSIKSAGFDTILNKPVRHQALMDCLERLFGASPGIEPAPPVAVPAESASGARILLAEDNAINVELAETVLVSAGYQVDVARDGVEAVSAVQAQRYALVLMDVQMPNLDGLDATRQIRALGGAYADLPIIAMTANAMQGDQEICFAAGMTDYVSKPIDYDRFLATVRHWSGRSTDEPQAVAVPSEDEPVIDEAHIGRLRTIMPGDRFATIVRAYLDGAGARLQRMAAAVERDDFAALGKELHDLLSTSGSLGARRVEAVAASLHQATKARDAEATRARFAQLKAASLEADAWFRASLATG